MRRVLMLRQLTVSETGSQLSSVNPKVRQRFSRRLPQAAGWKKPHRRRDPLLSQTISSAASQGCAVGYGNPCGRLYMFPAVKRSPKARRKQIRDSLDNQGMDSTHYEAATSTVQMRSHPLQSAAGPTKTQHCDEHSSRNSSPELEVVTHRKEAPNFQVEDLGT